MSKLMSDNTHDGFERNFKEIVSEFVGHDGGDEGGSKGVPLGLAIMEHLKNTWSDEWSQADQEEGIQFILDRAMEAFGEIQGAEMSEKFEGLKNQLNNFRGLDW